MAAILPPVPMLDDNHTPAYPVGLRLAERLPGARIVKAFNTVFSTVQSHPDLHGVTADAFVAADDPDAKRTVLDLAASIGLRPIDAGPLRHARYLEAIGCLGSS